MTAPTIADLQARCADMAQSKGFHLKRRAAQDADLMVHYRLGRLGLIATELGELMEEVREGRPIQENRYRDHYANRVEAAPGSGYSSKPEGVPSEAADILIRLLDWCGEEGINLEAAVLEKMAYNETRANMHGKRA